MEDHRFAYTIAGRVKVVEVPLSLTEGGLVLETKPVAEPVVIGADGGTFQFTVTVTNGTGEPQTLDLWTALDGPVAREPAFGPRTFTLAPGDAATRTLTQRVPAGAPAGTYTYTARVGTLGGAVAASSAFTFRKRAGLTSPPSASVPPDDAGWTASGWDEAMADGFRASARADGAVTVEGATPNPFAVRTTIHFTASRSAVARLAVYDLLGREVAVLVDGPVEAGPHAAAFDGASLPSGVYVWRLEAGGRTRTGRLTLLR
jgi:hypothetical protein